MTTIVWGEISERYYESGVDRGVLYVVGAASGVAWPGLVSVTEAPSGGSPRAYYYDGIKYLNLASAEEFEATIVAFNSPQEFNACCGIVSINNGLFADQQIRKPFNLTYRTLIGNAAQGLDHGYKIHLVYDALAAPSQRQNQTLSDSVNPISFSWNITTKPPEITGYRPTAHFVVDSRFTDPELMTELTDILYGTGDTDPDFPTVSELVGIFT